MCKIKKIEKRIRELIKELYSIVIRKGEDMDNEQKIDGKYVTEEHAYKVLEKWTRIAYENYDEFDVETPVKELFDEKLFENSSYRDPYEDNYV